MTTIAAELAKLQPTARIDLYVIDLTALSGPVMRYHPGANELSQPVVWQGQTYTMLGIGADGFDKRASGPAARPVVSIANPAGLVGALARQYNQLIGGTFIRKRTRARFLDAVNFAGGVNATADPTAEYPDDVWRFDRVARRDKTVIEWELVSPYDTEGVMLPRRQIQSTVCTVGYRSADCGYAGGPVAKADDTATSNPAEDKCGLRISSCKLRFGATAELPIGIYPGAGLVRDV
jgi:lambda family phage minor tail protein L